MRSKLIIIVTALVLIITSFLLFKLSISSKEEVFERFRAGQIATSREIVKDIKIFFNEKVQGLKILSSYPSLQNSDVKQITIDISKFFDYSSTNNIKSISVYNEIGTIIYSVNKNAVGRNYSQSDFLKWAVKKENMGNQFVSQLTKMPNDPKTNLSNSQFLLVSPIYRIVKYPTLTYKYVGAITFTINMEELLSTVYPIDSYNTKNENVMILDSNKTVLFHSEHPGMILKNIRQQDETCFQCHTSFKHVETILTKKEGTTEYILKEGPKKLASFSSFEFKNISWTVVITIPIEEAEGFFDKNLSLILILVGILVFTLIGGSFLIYFFNNRLKIQAQEEAKYWKDKRELEDQIRESEERYRSISQTANDAIINADSKGVIIDWNKAAEKIFGYEKKEVIGKTLNIIIPEQYRKKHIDGMERLLQGGEPHIVGKTIELHGLHKNGKIFPLELSLSQWQFSSGKFFTGMIRDITERKNAEKELLKLSRAVEQSPVSIIVTDISGNIEYVNPKLTEVTGYQREEVIGKNPRIFSSSEKPKSEYKVLWDSITSGNEWRGEFLSKKKNGELYWESASISPILNENGMITHFLAVKEDITERKLAEEAILKLSYQNKLILNSLGEGVYGLDNSGKTFFINPAAAAMLGYTVEELIGKFMHEIMHHTKADGTPYPHEECLIYAAFKNGVEYRVVDEVFWKKDGTSFPVEYVSTPIQEHDVWIGAVVVFKDITERKRFGEELRKLSLAVEQSPASVVITNLQGDIEYVNLKFCEVTGYSKEEAFGKNPRILNSGQQAKTVYEELWNTILSGKEWAGELLNKKKNGELYWESALISPIINEKGITTHFLAFKEDITERKRAEQEIISQKNRFAQLFENSPIAIALLDDQDKIVHINESFSELFGYFFEEIKGQMINDIIVSSELKEEAETYSNETLSGNQINKESYRKKKDGTLVYVQIVGVPVIVNDKTVGIYGMYVDLTQRKDAEEKMKVAKELAEQSNKMKDAFIANISHEIRTPLNGILGMSNLIKEIYSQNMSDEEEEYFKAIDKSSERIIRTIDLILNYSQLETGTFNFIPKQIELSTLCKNLVSKFFTTVKSKSLSLSFDNKLGQAFISADEYSISQVISNLIENAIIYTESGFVKVQLYQSVQNEILLDVSDSGIGIGSEYLAHIFESYRQEQMGYSRAYEGLGLGLAVVKKILDLHNASIKVKSKKGVGTTFTINFGESVKNIEEKTIIKNNADKVETAATKIDRLVLLVEDDDINQDIIKKFVIQKYRCIVTASYDGVMEILKNNKVDLILMDISLKGSIDGLEITKELKASKEYKHIPVIAETAHAFERDRISALAAGCDDYLSKPFSIHQLFGKIDKFLQ